MCVCSVTQLYLTLCDSMDCSLPSSFVHGIFQARILEWAAISYSRSLPDPGIEPMSLVSLAGRCWDTHTLVDVYLKVCCLFKVEAKYKWVSGCWWSCHILHNEQHLVYIDNKGFPGSSVSKESAWSVRDISWVRKIPWRKEMATLSSKPCGRRNLVGYSPQGCKNQTWLSD